MQDLFILRPNVLAEQLSKDIDLQIRKKPPQPQNQNQMIQQNASNLES